jgi:hypothetical protein
MLGYSRSIFISYAEEDLAFVEKLSSALTARGHAVGHYGSSVYSDWRQWAKKQIATADYGLVVWSSASIESQNVLSEAERIKRRGRYVPIRVDEAEVPLGFDTIQNFDLRGWTGNSDNHEWTKLLKRLDQTPENPREPPRSSPAAVMIVAAIGRFWSRLRVPLLTALFSGALGVAVVAGPWLMDNNNFADAVTEVWRNHPQDSDDQIVLMARKISDNYSQNKQHMWFHFVVVLVDEVNTGQRDKALEEFAIARWTLDKREMFERDRCRTKKRTVVDSKASPFKYQVNEAPDDPITNDPICPEVMRASSQENSIRREWLPQ